MRTALFSLALVASTTPAAQAQADSPVVVELFTSQSCYSCPPAEAFLSELARDTDSVVALEWHVDYWDELVYGAAGKWRDPYSSASHTQRQRRYNQNFTGVARAYTPQMVVNGQTETVGSDRSAVHALIAGAEWPSAHLTISATANGELAADLSGGSDSEVWLVRFLSEEVTDVLRGENQGKTLTNANVVKSFETLGQHRAATSRFTFAGPSHGEGCAIVVQRPNQGAIIAADYCPTESHS